MRRLTFTLAAGLALTCAACDHGHSQHAGMPRSQVHEARQLIAENCGACHRVPGVPRAQGRVGPSLEGISRQQIIAGHFVNTPENLARWIEHPQELLPGDAMPEMALSHEQVVRIVDYLYTVD
jgi:cytochrome c